ncbi:MAG TPA: SDR family oxidoreductase [Polyangiaceae bacterium]|jgi:NAD(P)-dependent dehydrogenase (short-subunit alcohol dehydrogenase family)
MTRRVLVTGANRGFGAALTAAFARQGAQVFAAARKGHTTLDAILERYPSLVTGIELDVTDLASVEAARDAVAERAPALDVLVNNAAMRSPTVSEPIESIDFADVARTFDVNAIGPLRVAQAFLPMLRAGDSPVFVNVSSEAGSIGQCWRDREFDYCMSKAALNMATAIFANLLRGKVHVFSMHPGWMRTDMGGPRASLDPEEVAEGVATKLLAVPVPIAAPFVDHEGHPLPW